MSLSIVSRANVIADIDAAIHRFNCDFAAALEWIEIERVQQMYIVWNARHNSAIEDATRRAACHELAIKAIKEAVAHAAFFGANDTEIERNEAIRNRLMVTRANIAFDYDTSYLDKDFAVIAETVTAETVTAAPATECLELLATPKQESTPHIVVYRKNGDLNCETKYYGPFADFGAAYDYLGTLPAVGVYDDELHAGQSGCKFVQALINNQTN